MRRPLLTKRTGTTKFQDEDVIPWATPLEVALWEAEGYRGGKEMMKVKRPLTPEDVRPKVVAKVSIPVVTYDVNGRPKLGHKTIDLLTKKNVGRPSKR